MLRRSLRVAIVEDNPSVRTALKRLLCANGCKVEVYDSGIQFIETANTTAYDCILLDMHMSPLSGLEVHVELIRRGSSVPIIFISAANDNTIREQALKQGALAYLQKPVTEDALLDVLSQIRRKKRAQHS